MNYNYEKEEESESLLMELLEIQADQINRWESVLKEDVFKFLGDWAVRKNVILFQKIRDGKKVDLHESVKRGTSLDCVVKNYMLGHRDLDWI